MSSRNAAVNSLLAELRAELLVAPADDVLVEHVAMMRLTAQAARLDAATHPLRARPATPARRASA